MIRIYLAILALAGVAIGQSRVTDLPVFPDLKCAAGVHDRLGFNVAGHYVTMTGKGGPFEIDSEGYITNDVDSCISDEGKYGYVLVEFAPYTTDVYYETEYGPEEVISCWTNYSTAGSPRGRSQTGPSIFGTAPYDGFVTYPLGYGPTSPIQYGWVACWVEGSKRFRIGFKP